MSHDDTRQEAERIVQLTRGTFALEGVEFDDEFLAEMVKKVAEELLKIVKQEVPRH